MHDQSLNDSFWLCISELQLMQYFFQIIFLVKETQHFLQFQAGLEREAESESIGTYFSTVEVKINIFRAFRGILQLCLHVVKDQWIKDHGCKTGLKIILHQCQG